MGTSESGALCDGLGHMPGKPTLTVPQPYFGYRTQLTKRKACALMELTVCLRTQDSLKAVDVSGPRCPWRPPPPGPADRALQGELGAQTSLSEPNVIDPTSRWAPTVVTADMC